MSCLLRQLSSPHYRGDSKSTEMEEGKLIFYPRALDITWGGDSRYWKLPSKDMPKEKSVAELKQVSWLEVTGSTNEIVKIGKTYKVGFNISLKPDAFGWNEYNVYIMAKIGKKGKFIYKQVCLNEEPIGKNFNVPKNEDLKIKVQISNESDYKLYFGMYEVWSKKWKGGLNIHYAFVEEM